MDTCNFWFQFALGLVIFNACIAIPKNVMLIIDNFPSSEQIKKFTDNVKSIFKK